MSFRMGAEVRGLELLRNFGAATQDHMQASINEAAMAGYEWLIDESEGQFNTPIDFGDLISTVDYPYQNQRSVTFRIAGVLTDPASGRPNRPYGFAQEFGWHDRADVPHEGHHMVEYAAQLAGKVFIEYMTEGGKSGVGLAEAVFGGTYRYFGRR
jgi:hypothetical protein